LQIELIQQRNEAPSLYLDFLHAGHEGLQHLGYDTRHFDTDLARLLEMGYSVGHAGSVSGRGRFVYLLQKHPGTIVELFDMSQGRIGCLPALLPCATGRQGRFGPPYDRLANPAHLWV
jgi:hypothetical protein